MNLSENLLHLRTSHAVTQEQLAARLGVTRQSVARWEMGTSIPEMNKLIALCDFFGCTLDDLVRGDLTREDPAPASLDTAVDPGARARGGMSADPQAAVSSADPVGRQADGTIVPSAEEHAKKKKKDDKKRTKRRVHAVCGVIMMVATVVALLLLLIPAFHTDYFWVSWPIGAVVCMVIEEVVKCRGAFRE